MNHSEMDGTNSTSFDNRSVGSTIDTDETVLVGIFHGSESR